MQLNAKIKVVLVEDEIILRQNIAAKIQRLDPDFLVTAQADNGLLALESMAVEEPDVLMTDIKMPVMDGIELIRRTRRTYPKVNIVILSGYSDFSYTQQAIRFGVANYLLKPVEDDALMDVLQELKTDVVTAQYYPKHTVIYSDHYVRGISQQMGYVLFDVCLGNLCCDVTDAYLQSFYARQSAVNWTAVLGGLDQAIRDWYVSDQEEPNQKLVCCRILPGTELDAEAVMVRLHRRLEKAAEEVPVSICTSRYALKREDVWMCAQRCKMLLRQKLVPAQSNLFLLERDEMPADEERLGIVKMRVQDQLRQSIERRDTEEIRRELEMIFRYLVNHNSPQQDIQKVILYIIRMCEFSGQGEIAANQAKVLRTLSCAVSRQSLTGQLVSSLLHGTAPQEELADLKVQLVEFVDRHYLQLVHLEDITQEFQYSYAYLSKLFKKQTGQSLTEYVLEKRLKLSKSLIENNGDFSVAQIAEMAGFSDRRYFQRAFKSYTGMSVKEYKNQVIIKG